MLIISEAGPLSSLGVLNVFQIAFASAIVNSESDTCKFQGFYSGSQRLSEKLS